MYALDSFHRPVNVRKLENVVERMLAYSDDNHLTINDLPAHILMESHDPSAFKITIPDERIALESVEHIVIQEIISRTGSNHSKVARLLKIPRHPLIPCIKKLGLL
jgi:transcriptional regulator with PAS, ATPase and Fis domain